MLILTRKTSETIRISDNVEVVVLSVNGDKVRIGINAPKTIPVHRAEIYEKINSQKDKNTPVENNRWQEFD